MSKKEIYKLQNGSDIRGYACGGPKDPPVNLTNEISYKIGAAFVQWLSIKTKKEISQLKIGLGRDCRITGESLLTACAAGIKNAGALITDCGLATTPAMFMSCVFEETKFDGSVMVTASHLPSNRNGLKFFDKDGGLDHEDIAIILEMADSIEVDAAAEKNAESELKKNCPKFDLISRYAEHLKSAIIGGVAGDSKSTDSNSKPLSGLKIVVDAGNGNGGFFVDKILKPLGADTTGSQFLEPDGLFPNHIPNPENKEAMASVQKATVDAGADLGLIFDTDVDRMSAVLGDGREVNRDSIIAMFAAILAPEHPKSTIVTDSVTSDHLTYFLEKELGLNHLRFVRGYKNVINKQKELTEQGIDCPLAMETSGHGALKENYFLDDGAFLAVKLLVALAKAKAQGKSLESLIAKLPPAGKEAEFRFNIQEEDFETYGKAVLEDFEQYAYEGHIKIEKSYEGVRLSFNSQNCHGWMLLRLSLHDPVMPLNMEGRTEEDLEHLKLAARRLLGGFDGLDLSPLGE